MRRNYFIFWMKDHLFRVNYTWRGDWGRHLWRNKAHLSSMYLRGWGRKISCSSPGFKQNILISWVFTILNAKCVVLVLIRLFTLNPSPLAMKKEIGNLPFRWRKQKGGHNKHNSKSLATSKGLNEAVVYKTAQLPSSGWYSVKSTKPFSDLCSLP